MPFWGWLAIIGTTAVAVFVSTAVAFSRRKKPSGKQDPVDAVKTAAHEQEVKILENERDALQAVADNTAKTVEGLNEQHGKNIEKLKEAQQGEYEALADNPDELDRKLNSLLAEKD